MAASFIGPSQMAEAFEPFRGVLQLGGAALWQYDPGAEAGCFAPECYSLLGYEPAEFPPTPDDWLARVHPEDAPCLRLAAAELRSGACDRLSLQLRIRRKDGEWAWVQAAGQMVTPRVGPLLGLLQDVSDRRRLEREVARLRARLESPSSEGSTPWRQLTLELDDTAALLARAILHSPVAIVVTDAHTRLEYANPAFYAMSGYEAGEMVGRRIGVLKSGIHPPDFYAGMWRVVSAGQDWHGEFCNRRRDGTRYWVSSTISPVCSPAGGITHFVCVQRDVTSEKMQLIQQDQTRLLLERSRRLEAVGLAVAGAAHCIRNVLTVMQGSMGILQTALESGNTARVPQAMEALRRSLARLTNLTSNMIDHSRTRTPLPEPVPVGPFLESIALQLRQAYGSRGVEVQVEGPGNGLHWDFDPHLIERCLQNLATNAMEAIHDGGVIRFRAEALEGDGTAPPRLMLEVQDSGCGIDACDLPRVFDQFFTTKLSSGTGLGLANVRDFVRLHGGEITVESQPGRGTTFRICLPGCRS